MKRAELSRGEWVIRASQTAILCVVLLPLASPVLTKGEELGAFTDTITIPENKHLWIDGRRIPGPEVSIRWDGTELWIGNTFRCRVTGRWLDGYHTDARLVDEYGRVERIRELMTDGVSVREALERWYLELRELRLQICDLSRSGRAAYALELLAESPLIGRVLRFRWPEGGNAWLPPGFVIASLPSDTHVGYYARGDSTKLVAYLTLSDPCDHGREVKPYLYPEYPTARDNGREVVEQIRQLMQPSDLGVELVFMSGGSRDVPPEISSLTSMSISGKTGDPEIARILKDIEDVEQGGDLSGVSGGRGVPWQDILHAVRSW